MKKARLLELSLLSFFFIATSALSLSKVELDTKIATTPLRLGSFIKRFKPLPVLAKDANFPVFSAQSVVALDVDTGVTLYEKDPDKLLLPASTTKIVTALVAMDTFKDSDVLTVGPVTVQGQRMRLISGEKMIAEDLLSGLLIFSANDAAEVFAGNFPGGRDAFIIAMNAKAKELNMNSSNFTNPAGLDGENQKTTAKDLARVAGVAMTIPRFSEIVKQKEKVVTSIDGRIIHRLTSTNELLGKVPGVFGVKTGWTENARENLVTYLNRDGRKVMIVVLGSQDRFGETTELIDWIFANYEWSDVSFVPDISTSHQAKQ